MTIKNLAERIKFTVICAAIAGVGILGFTHSSANIVNVYGHKVGQIARLNLIGMDLNGIDRAILYQDGVPHPVELNGKKYGSAIVELSAERGMHTYQFEIVDSKGDTTKGQKWKIFHSGEIIDREPFDYPEFKLLNGDFGSRREPYVGDTAEFYICVQDQGDNAGFSNATLYENEKPILSLDYLISDGKVEGNFEVKKKEPEFLGRNISFYRVKTIDLAGHVTWSGNINPVFFRADYWVNRQKQ